MRLEARSRKSGARTRKLQRGLARGLFILASVLWLRAPAFSQTVTQISDTLKNADGTPASGRIVVTWDAFTQTGGVTVAAGSLSYTVTSGVIDLSLAYNSPGTGTVFNTAYRVDFYLANSSIYHELWAVPSSGPVALKDIVIGRSPG